MKKKSIVIVSLIIGTLFLMQACSDSTGQNTMNETTVNVETSIVSKITESQEITYSGTIEESENLPLSFSSMGTVAKVLVSEGEFVKKGQLLASLNSETYKNSYEMALASEKQAEDAYNRLKPMYENGNLPEIKFIDVKTGLTQAKASAAIAKKSLDDCNLYSTTDGLIGKKSIDPGMNVMPGITAINIVKIEKVYAKVSISENEISSIRKNQKAIVKIGALNNKVYHGVVEEIGVVADPIVHTYKIKIAIINNEQLLKPGMICNVVIDNSNNSEQLVVPSYSVLVDENGKTFVFIVENNTAQKKYVATGKLLRDGVEVIDGLELGDRVVISGQQKLVDGISVKIVNK